MIVGKSVYILGAGGHAKVLIDMLRRLKLDIAGLVDPKSLPHGHVYGVDVIGGDDAIQGYVPETIELVNGIGSIPRDGGLRRRIFESFHHQGYKFKTLVDGTAFVASDVVLQEGVQVMVGAIIQIGARIDANCIVNTGAIIDHDCQVGQHVHIAPGAILSGGVCLGDNVHIGTGAKIIQGITIGANTIVGAGCVITHDIERNRIVYPSRCVVDDSDSI